MKEGEAAMEILLRGVVQGVGFRPFVHRLALREGLKGWVRNDAGAVTVRARGSQRALKAFRDALTEEVPPLARVNELTSREVPPEEWTDFRILPSEVEGARSLPVSPDVATCPSCLQELLDPGNRRHRYPFITCTDCGPRFTIIREMPYDRERTSMAAFTQCAACLAEYLAPGDRRHHSETNSCPACGPRIWFEGGSSRSGEEGSEEEGRPPTRGMEEALTAASSLLLGGGILAMRGLGGFHLAVDATNDGAVRLLRERKGREGKPLAIMVRGVEEARALGEVGEEEEEFLASRERPVVLLAKGEGSPLSPAVSPGLETVGVMTAYTPLHHLLVETVGRPLVMTSGNPTDEPIATGNAEARERLAGVADGFLLHDRGIVARYDDSVVRVTRGGPLLLRRARGFAPLPLSLPVAAPEALLAVGPHLKNTFTLAQGETAYPSQHIGDMESLGALEHFHASLDRLMTLFRIKPERVVRDLHPGYLTTRVAWELARAWGCPPPLEVQHHHAHVAAVLGEHREGGPAVGVAFDGTGYGEDGTVWGGEVLVADLKGFRRVGHLRSAPLPGGEAAVREPWRTAVGYLSLDPGAEEDFALAFRGIQGKDRDVVEALARQGVNAPLHSSLGRLFDAAAAVLGLRQRNRYEGQGAMELESAAERARRNGGGVEEVPFPWESGPGGVRVMDPLPLLRTLGRARREGTDPGLLALAFHRAVTSTTLAVALEVCREEGIETVALGGGVFQNAILLGDLFAALEREGLRVLVPRLLSPNDGAVSYGQAVVAAARLVTGEG